MSLANVDNLETVAPLVRSAVTRYIATNTTLNCPDETDLDIEYICSQVGGLYMWWSCGGSRAAVALACQESHQERFWVLRAAAAAAGHTCGANLRRCRPSANHPSSTAPASSVAGAGVGSGDAFGMLRQRAATCRQPRGHCIVHMLQFLNSAPPPGADARAALH